MSIAAKICGLNSDAAVAAAVEGGAAYLGFVFYPPSPRAVSPERAAQLCAAVPSGMQRVGLFVDADDAAIAAVLDLVPIDMLQLQPTRPEMNVGVVESWHDKGAVQVDDLRLGTSKCFDLFDFAKIQDSPVQYRERGSIMS